jgi:membrane-anchored mycosin MYCP
LAVALAASAIGAPVSATASAEAQCAAPAGVYRDTVGWAQKLVDPARIWPLSDGSGQVVAVVGTGVDASNGQFGPGQVRSIPSTSDGDCDGRGTFAAGIVAARPNQATTFTGVAPGARILGIRYTQATSGGNDDGPDPDALATAITEAVAGGATVVLVAVPATRASPALAAAVTGSLARDVVVVSPATGTEAGRRSYPTALPGVIAVGAHDRAGAAVQAEAGAHLTLAAPGADLVSTSAGTGGALGHRWGVTDPGFAAAYVAGTVALLRAYRPALTPAAVLERLMTTASRPSSGSRDDRLGWGTLNAYAAVAAELPAGTARPPTAVRLVTGSEAPQGDGRPAGMFAILGVALAGSLAVSLAVVRRGRARKWRG